VTSVTNTTIQMFLESRTPAPGPKSPWPTNENVIPSLQRQFSCQFFAQVACWETIQHGYRASFTSSVLPLRFVCFCVLLVLRTSNVKYTVCVPVPTSSHRMLEKSLTTNSDIVIYDLEDSVPPKEMDKDSARKRLNDFLSVCTKSLSHFHTAFNSSVEHLGR
jgi:hypothetical protein